MKPMRLPSCLVDPNIPLVADASVAINLNATGYIADILRALPNPVIVTDVVLEELNNGHRPRKDLEILKGFVKKGLIEVVQLSEASENLFVQLVGGTAAQTIDDGEASTLAYASEVSGIPLIDERKAIRICRERFPILTSACTVDILSHSCVQNAFAQEDLSDAVFNALIQARMRVLPHHVDWVIELIGHERARLCNSLSRAARFSMAANR
jgi:predicted nucleic acid-binding protein